MWRSGQRSAPLSETSWFASWHMSTWEWSRRLQSFSLSSAKKVVSGSVRVMGGPWGYSTSHEKIKKIDEVVLTYERLYVTSQPCVSVVSSRSGQPVEVHRIWKRSRTPGGSRTSCRRERRDRVLRGWRLRHRGIQICKTLVSVLHRAQNKALTTRCQLVS